jgi:hypothetical protein
VAAAYQITMSTTPSRRNPTPMISGGPTPSHESPDSEFAGSRKS